MNGSSCGARREEPVDRTSVEHHLTAGTVDVEIDETLVAGVGQPVLDQRPHPGGDDHRRQGPRPPSPPHRRLDTRHAVAGYRGG
ncbi:hypothetical protein ACFSTC_57035 [Nonomuraea ferruginea]